MTTAEVQQQLAKHNIPWDDFQSWMHGQTVGMDESGGTNWYDHDVERFIKHALRGTKESSVQWD